MGRKILLSLGLYIFLLWGWASAETFETFRGFKWGTDKSLFSDLVAGPQRENVEVYTRKEAKKVGNIEVENIYYMFYKNKFGAAMITFQGDTYAAMLKEALMQKYGPSQKPDPSAEKIVWDLSELRILFDFASANKNGSIEYYYKPIVQQREEDRTKKKGDVNRKTIDDL